MKRSLSKTIAAVLAAVLLAPAALGIQSGCARESGAQGAARALAPQALDLQTPARAATGATDPETDVAPGYATEPSAPLPEKAIDNPNGTVYLLVCPKLSWSDITNDQTPTIQYLAGNHAVANVITESKVDTYTLDENPRFHYLRINAKTPAEIDNAVASIYSKLGANDSLIITSSPSLAKIDSFRIEGYALFILVDAGDNGLLTSSTVRRSGLITSGNAGAAIEALLQSPQRHPGNLSVFALTEGTGALGRTTWLARQSSIAASIQDSQDSFITIFLIGVGITLAFSIGLLFLDARIQPSFLEHFLPATRILWIIVLAIPLGSYLMFLQLPSLTNAEIALDYFAFAVMEISFVCIIIALVFRWSYALFFMLGSTTALLLVDQLLGGPMTATGYLSYAPIETTRYYGIGNEGASLAFGAWIMLSGLILNQFEGVRSSARKRSAALDHFKRWGFPAVSAAIILVIAAPWWGANFGVIIWGIVSAAVAWALFNDIDITWKQVVAFTAISAVMAFFVLVLDSTYNFESHMGTTADSLARGWHLVALEIVFNMLRLSVNTLFFSPALSVAFFAILAFLLWLRVAKPGIYAQFWQENKTFKNAYSAILVASVLMLLVEDSGILMPALILLYNIAGLLWLVCDRHSWHIRKWVGRRISAIGEA